MRGLTFVQFHSNQTVSAMLKKIVKKIKSVLLWEIYADTAKMKIELNSLSKLAISQIEINQRLLALKYKELSKQGRQFLPDLSETGFRVHSQFEEDGILLYIFSIIGEKTKKSVEIGTSDGTECNTSNLILYHGWRGLLIDGDKEMIRRGTAFFAQHPNAVLNEPKLVNSWITKDNINDTVRGNGFEGEIDLLSIDIDGVDYYILKSLTCITPRVIICEINSAVPLGKALTVPYSDNFYCWDKPFPESLFRSMSLTAANKLMKSKGYRMVGAHKLGFNIIFIKNGIAEDVFPEISLEQARGPYFNHIEMGKDWESIKDYAWVEV
jgi:hypothetical protein